MLGPVGCLAQVHDLQQLGAEENLFKEMEITGLMHSRTVDVASITIGG